MERMHEFVVSGNRSFPIDMLRYDTCWPRTQQDTAAIQRSLVRGSAEAIALKGLRSPTEGRWSSFGYTVSDVTRTLARWAPE